MNVLIVILVLIGVFVLASVVLGRTTHQVQSVSDTEYLELEGHWIRYRVAGGGPPVVLVHGWLSSGRIWERITDRLAQRFTVYTLDLSGFGDSDKPVSGYGVRYGSRLLYAFCAHFGLARTAVVGHGFGGVMAVKLAADHPDVVGRLVLVATPAKEDQVDLPTLLWFATLPVVGPVFYALGRLFRPLRRLWMRPFVLDPEDLTEEVVDDAGKSVPAAVQKTLDVTRREIARGRLLRQAGTVKVPILAVAGEEDQIVDPLATEDWARTVSAEVILMNECGHLPMLERTSEFNAQVFAFLTGDPHHLDAITEAPEKPEDEETAFAQTPEEPPPLTPDEPDVTPTIVRKEEGHYPPRDREDAGDRPDTSPGPAADQTRDQPPGDAGEPPRRRRAAAEGGPFEVPGDLFEWPESLKEFRPPPDRSRGADRQASEERDEDADSEGPEPEGPEPEGPEPDNGPEPEGPRP